MLTLYGTASCAKCIMAKNALNANRVKYHYVDIMKDMDAAKEIADAGLMELPVMRYNGVLQKFNLNEVK